MPPRPASLAIRETEEALPIVDSCTSYFRGSSKKRFSKPGYTNFRTARLGLGRAKLIVCFHYTMRLLLSALLIVALPPSSYALDNGLGLTPILGFNSWNSAACHVTEGFLRSIMDLFVSTGLRDAGYRTVATDDCWAQSRDPVTNEIVPDAVAFPSGMKALADYAHTKGLLFGIYSSNSPKTCAQRPGSWGFEELDAATYASWGVSLVKYDNCGNQAEIGPPEVGYAKMRDALNATGRPIFFAACEWAVDFPSTWMKPVANTWRTTYDIQNKWECVTPHVDWQNVFADYFGPGAFGDMDILEVGNGVLNDEENVAHFSLWVFVCCFCCTALSCPCAQPSHPPLPTLLHPPHNNLCAGGH